MALKHLRSSTANKRPLPSGLADGQLASNTEQTSPGLFFKNASGSLVKVGPVHVGATAPNATPASGGETGNTIGEQWLDTSGTNPVLKIWDGSGWASEAGEFVNASGDTMTGALVMDNQQQVRFRETTANGTNFIAVQAPASVSSDKTLTLPDVTGTIVSTGDTGTVTSTMIADGTIVDADVNASAAIVDTKLATISTAGKVSNSATTATSANTASAIVARDGSGNFSAGTITASLTGAASSNVLKAGDTMTGALATPLGSATAPSLTFSGDTNTGIYSPGADQVAVATNGSERARIDSSGRLLVGTSTSTNNVGNDSHLFAVVNAGDGQIGGATFTTYGGTASTTFRGNVFYYQRSRGITDGSFTILAANDSIARHLFRGSDGSAFRIAAEISAYVDATPTENTSVPGRLVFSTTADGASSTTEQLRITSDRYVRLASGTGGIQFNGDTASANALDDYEEGTWTPTFESASAGPTPGASATYSGKYVKVGKVVTCYFSLNFNDSGTNSAIDDRITMGGLPFTSSYGQITAVGSGWLYSTFSSGNNSFWQAGISSATNFFLYCHHTDGTTNYGQNIRGTIVYEAA